MIPSLGGTNMVCVVRNFAQDSSDSDFSLKNELVRDPLLIYDAFMSPNIRVIK